MYNNLRDLPKELGTNIGFEVKFIGSVVKLGDTKELESILLSSQGVGVRVENSRLELFSNSFLLLFSVSFIFILGT